MFSRRKNPSWWVIALPFLAYGYCIAADDMTFQLPFYEDAIVVPVTVNGADRLFVLDSGATRHAFHTSLRKYLGEPTRQRLATAADGSEIHVEEFQAPQAAVGRQPLSRVESVACVDLSSVRAAMGKEIEGILGIPFFASHIIQVDFDAREMRILPASTEATEEWGQRIDVVFESNSPVVNARFGMYDNEPCVIDTGFTGSLGLRSEVFVYLTRMRTIAPQADQLFAILEKLSSAQSGVLSEFEVAGKSHKDLYVTNSGPRSRIGLDYLRRYKVTFDLARRRIFLAPGFDFGRPERPIVGVGLLRRDSRTVVAAVLPESAAARAGFLVGDELMSLDNEEVAGRPIAEIQWMLRRKARLKQDAFATLRRSGDLKTLTLSCD